MSALSVSARRGAAVAVVSLTAVASLGLGGGTASAFPLDFGSSGPGDGARCTTTAAEKLGWGAPERYEGFDDASSLNNWIVYDGPGHAGNGRRTPAAVSVADGALTITAQLNGDSGGLMPRWGGRKYGRWEVCSRATMSGPAWTAAALLWPDAEDWPAGGEVDFMEVSDPTRQIVGGYIHYRTATDQEVHLVNVDATAWRSWAVEWTEDRLAFYVDGRRWALSTNRSHFPPRAMHLALQLDNFGGITFPAGRFHVDRVAEYGV